MNRFSLMLRRSSSWPLCTFCNISLCSSCSRRSLHTCRDSLTMSTEKPRILLYILRRDARLSDNPIFTAASKHATDSQSSADTASRARSPADRGASFTHLLPVYVFPAQQIEVSGFLASSSDQSPYPEARSELAKIWRTGPHRTKFIAEGAWDLKESLEGLGCGSGLQLRVGLTGDVVKNILEYYSKSGGSKGEIAGVWMTRNESVEEKEEEQHVAEVAQQHGVDFHLWQDEKYYIDKYVFPDLMPHFIGTNVAQSRPSVR
jgi:deoxyribodipyrimidine photo-lyase